MRISDWSSDVCSSDLRLIRTPATNAEQLAAKRRVFREEKAHEFFDVGELIPAIFGDAERLAGGGKAGIGGQVDKHILPAASDVTETGWETKWLAMQAALDTYDCAPSEIWHDVEDVLGTAYLKAQQEFRTEGRSAGQEG